MNNLKKQKKKFSKTRSLAISQIILLIIGTIAISYALGSEIGEVSGWPGVVSFTYQGKSCENIGGFGGGIIECGNERISWSRGTWKYISNGKELPQDFEDALYKSILG
ncbi:MAG: hypothetical protein DRZ76_02905, partial [Candidatus Nealsonbacteria bacterium]